MLLEKKYCFLVILMINEKNVKKYASTVLLSTVDDLFDNKKDLIDNFYKDFVATHKRNKNLKNNYKDNEVVDELILEELEKVLLKMILEEFFKKIWFKKMIELLKI